MSSERSGRSELVGSDHSDVRRPHPWGLLLARFFATLKESAIHGFCEKIGGFACHTRARMPAQGTTGCAGMSWQWEMRDFRIVTFAVDPDRLAALLPHSFEPETFTLDSGREWRFVSAVPFRAVTDIGGGWFPLGFVQVNYRAYIRRHGERCVWFFGSSVSSRIVSLPRMMLRAALEIHGDLVDSSWEMRAGVRICSPQVRGLGWRPSLNVLVRAMSLGGWTDLPTFMKRVRSLLRRFRGFVCEGMGRCWSAREARARFPRRPRRRGPLAFRCSRNSNLCAPTRLPYSVLLLESTTFNVLPVECLGNASKTEKSGACFLRVAGCEPPIELSWACSMRAGLGRCRGRGCRCGRYADRRRRAR